MSTRRRTQSEERISRRESMRRGVLGAGGILLADRLRVNTPAVAANPSQPSAQVKAKSVIQIFLWGGMSHNDTWDPKPDSGRTYTGEFGDVVSTNVVGIQLSQLFPKLA